MKMFHSAPLRLFDFETCKYFTYSKKLKKILSISMLLSCLCGECGFP